VLAQWIEKSHHVGDLSVQIHYGVGNGNEQKLKLGQAWHRDAENSLLHSRRMQKNDSNNLCLAREKLTDVLAITLAATDLRVPTLVQVESHLLMLQR
jgi:hypothetical protein